MPALRMSLIVITWVLLSNHEAISITIAIGSQEGTYYKIAQDIKQIAEKGGIPIEVISTNKFFDNINLLGARKVDLAIAHSHSAEQRDSGRNRTSEMEELVYSFNCR